MLQPLREQMDPENMIEEEYRLSTNEAYVFRVMRKLRMRRDLDIPSKKIYNKDKRRFDPELLVKELDKLQK